MDFKNVFIHPSSFIDEHVDIDEGTKILTSLPHSSKYKNRKKCSIGQKCCDWSKCETWK